MSDWPLHPEPATTDSVWSRFKARPRWQRVTAYAALAAAAVGTIGAVTDDPRDDSAEPSAIETAAGVTAPPAASTRSATLSSAPSPPSSSTSMPGPAVLAPTPPAASTTTPPATSPTTPPAPSTTVPGAVLALDVLALIPVANEEPSWYVRDRFGYPTDSDGDGCDTRAEVLQRDSLTPAQVDPFGCTVIAGDWRSVYDGAISQDPAAIEIDHVVALKEAHDSGAWAWAWDPARLVAFGNDLDDPRTLRPVTAAINQDKGDADPSNWVPPDPAALCGYLGDWVATKARWGLSMDQSEHGRIRNLLTERCAGYVIAPWPASPPAPAAAPTTTPPPPVQPAIPQPAGECDPSYPTVCTPPSPPDLDCAAITARHFEVRPPDPHRFDGNSGVGCEG